jgi:hypothetical protein
MAHALKGSLISSARSGFGTYTPKQSYYDYLTNIDTRYLYQRRGGCNKLSGQSQSDYIKLKNFKNSIKCEALCDTLPFNKTNLNINLITKEDLQGVIVVESKTGSGPSTIDPSLNPFYTYYNVDPSNVLVGTNPCEIGNYRNFMVLSTPSTAVVVQPSQVAGC